MIASVSEDTIKHKYIKTNMIFGLGNNPMVGATVACALLSQSHSDKGFQGFSEENFL